ncbi:MAG: hypothetical protein WAK12_00120 [Acidimicrobiales bacterium]
MIRFLGALLIAGLLLSACGSISATSAMAKWVRQSSYVANNHTLLNDARHSANALRNASMTNLDLHTVCAVLYLESEEANAALPTPDQVTTSILGKAYNNLGAGANVCYDAASSTTQRTRALRYLSEGVAELSEASARIASVTSS